MTIQSISNPKISLNILSDEDVRKLHTATLDVLETTGVRFPSAVALEILAAHGAKVDAGTQVARIPGAVIEEYLAKAPPAYTLAALNPARDLPLDGNHSHLATDGCGVEILDAFTGQRRRFPLGAALRAGLPARIALAARAGSDLVSEHQARADRGDCDRAGDAHGD
jgi:trimethylamine--corrinoid protein Co-methyltransferase